jgi:hypothetical protein
MRTEEHAGERHQGDDEPRHDAPPAIEPRRRHPRESGHFRFVAGDGEWTLRTLAPRADVVDWAVAARVGSVAEVAIAV